MRVLHLLSQRPGRTGSGVTLDALVRGAGAAGWEQTALVGTPAEDPRPVVADLPPERVRPLVFDRPPLPFPLPGMSDVMPYASTRWRDLTPEALGAYREAWRGHLRTVLADFRPDVIHAHHVWLLASLVKDVAPDVPLVVHGHATGLRQMASCPHLAAEVRRGVRRAERILALTAEHARMTAEALGVPPGRVAVVGAGYRDDLFHLPPVDGPPPPHALVYAGKYSHAKGLPWLLDAVERIAARVPDVRLHIAGSGGGEEADQLARRMDDLTPIVERHGALTQPELAALLRRSAVFVLPSFYEGLPLVVVEAVASGCRVVCTDLPTVREELAPALGDHLDLVGLPRLSGPDDPVEADLPAFQDALVAAIERQLARPSPRRQTATPDLTRFTWSEVFARVERIWREVGAGPVAPATAHG